VHGAVRRDRFDRGRRSSFAFASVLVLSCTSASAQGDEPPLEPIGAEAFEVLRDLYEYDTDVPLECRTVHRLEEPEYVREKLVFRGIRDSRVPALLAVPKGGEGPYPCVILLHGIGGSKEGWWRDGSSHSGRLLTERLLRSGHAVLTLDAPYHGERIASNDFESADVFLLQRGWMQRARDMVVQSVVEHRRAIDVLAARDDIDPSRLGVVGYSMGGMLAFMLTAIEPRIEASVACVTPILSDSYSAMSVHNYAPRISRQPFLMLMAEADAMNYTEARARRLYSLIAAADKEVHFYQGGHVLPAEWVERAAEWVESRLR
jgi:dienelactone hydrolase